MSEPVGFMTSHSLHWPLAMWLVKLYFAWTNRDTHAFANMVHLSFWAKIQKKDNFLILFDVVKIVSRCVVVWKVCAHLGKIICHFGAKFSNEILFIGKRFSLLDPQSGWSEN